MVVSESSINNIMGGLESTGGVTLHNHRRKLKQRFETIAKLGQGTYGKVQLGINKETGQEVAIKTIKKCKIETEADLIRIRREIQIMSSLRHPYIIHIYEVFENRDKMVLVMEYAAGGELYDYLSKKKVLDEQEARRIFRQIAMAVYYCHKHQICHRDLKLENILLDEQGNAKIADFGLSNVFDKSRLLSTFCGSPLYASPEIVKGIPYNGPEVDCWSMGVLLYTLVYGAMPFDGSNFKRLVRQISAGEYFEPKVPSSASELIAGLLTVKGSERLDITGVCQHPWMSEEGKVSCFRLAVELAEQEPNRLDLLLALAPQEAQIPSVPEEMAASQQAPERPARSLSLSSLPTVQPSFTAPIPTPPKDKEEPEKPPDKEKKRERSSSKTRKKETDEEKPKKKSVKTKKKSDPDLSKEEMEKVLEEAKKLSEIIAKAPVVETSKLNEVSLPEPVQSDLPKPEEPSPSPPQPKAVESKEESKEKPKEIKKVKKVKQEKKDEEKDQPVAARPSLRKEKEVDLPDKEVDRPESVPREAVPAQKEAQPPSTPQEGPSEPPAPFRRDSVRRKSKVFETAEMFSKSPTQEKVPPKKVFLPGVKVSDAKAAFERRSSISQETKPDVSLASTINVNKLVQSELNLDKDNKEEEKMKKEKAVKVISHAISESGMNKASTLPRRKLSKPSIAARTEAEPPVVRTAAPPTPAPAPAPAPCPPPVPPPRPSLSSQESGPREYIIPIQVERREDKPPPVSKQASLSSRTSSISSIGRQDSDSSTATVGTPSLSASAEPIRKSPREVIIPIAVEGGGFITPSASTLSKMSSLSEGEDEERPAVGPLRGFGLHSTRRRVEATDSLSSDEEDDNFEMLTAENLFSSLLSRVRNLTYRLNENEGRPSFPRLFNHSIFDSPASRRRLTETKSFSDQDPAPWRRKRETTPSSTLPRGFTARSFRRTLTGGDENRREGRPPVGIASSRTRKRSEEEVVEDFLATGKLSSLDRVRSYLEGLRRGHDPSPAPPLRRYLSESPRSDHPPPPRHRLASLGRTDQYLGEERNLLDGQKKTWRSQSDAWTQNGENGLVSPSRDCNGFFERYSSPRRDTEGCVLPRRANTPDVPERPLPRTREDYNNAFRPASKIPTSEDKLTDESLNQNVRIEKNNDTQCLSNNHTLTNSESIKKLLQNSGDTKIVDYINNEPIISDLNGKSSKLQKASEKSKLRKNSEGGSKTSKSNYKQDTIVGGCSEQLKNEGSKKKSVITEGTESCNEAAQVAVQSSTEVNQIPNLEKNDIPEKSLSKSELKKIEKSVKKESKKDRNGSRVSKAINSLRKKSETYENQFTESKLLKRAVSLEDLRSDEAARSKRASSLKPEGTKESPKARPGRAFESKGKEEREARLANLKRLELVKGGGEASAESTPTGDQDEEGSLATDNSDTWSSCDLGDRPLDPSTEECVLERIRRKSFYHRFNLPKRQAYNRSLSNMERKRFY